MENYVRVPEGSVDSEGFTSNRRVSALECGATYYAEGDLPEGVVGVGKIGLAAKRLLTPELNSLIAGEAIALNKPVRIAVFDFDGTSISGNSPVMLVRYLNKLHMLTPAVVFKILCWAGAYKFRLPQNESWVRGLVFTAFQGKPVAQVNKFLRDFYDEIVEKRFRLRIGEEMQKHLDQGHIVVCVSATFEPIIAQAMLKHPIQFGIATRMRQDWQGCYTTEVEGLPIEGDQKIVALTQFANELFGEGAWQLDWAYGDHHSDRTLLAAAENAHAVTPDRPLTRTARENGYEILDWQD